MPIQKQNNQPKISSPETWVDTHGDYLYRFALSRLRNPELAQNAVQETFLAAIKSKGSFSGRSSEKTWLIGILKHKIIDHYRKNYREIPVTDMQTEQEAIDDFFDYSEHPKKFPTNWSPDPRELAGTNEFWLVFEGCLKKLPKATADAFSMREIDNMQSEEICKILGITATNLWVMLHRARLQLRGCLETNWFEK